MTVKEQALSAISMLPEDASIDDALDKILFLKKVDQGLKDIEDGRFITHEKLKKKFNI
jgi:predicted transcriptional regulator